ncbi:MAG: hypothetical protein HY519_04445 [Candidatus Aenigmarchaeota archaeon]|nr:hypothetical protein [Candidatus Aenigmarchaeota archaeon]
MTNSRRWKGQMNMVLVVLALAIFLGLSFFFLSLLKPSQDSDYLNLYAHALLRTMLKSETGYLDPDCRSLEDLLACAYYQPAHVCAANGRLKEMACEQALAANIAQLTQKYDIVKGSYRYLLAAESGAVFFQAGDVSLDKASSARIAADRTVSKISSDGRLLQATVRLYLARK